MSEKRVSTPIGRPVWVRIVQVIFFLSGICSFSAPILYFATIGSFIIRQLSRSMPGGISGSPITPILVTFEAIIVMIFLFLAWLIGWLYDSWQAHYILIQKEAHTRALLEVLRKE